jgi:hypothetical protein
MVAKVEPITSNVDLRVQALSHPFHDELVLLAVQSDHPVHNTFHEVTARRIYCIGSLCIGRVLGPVFE